MKFFGKFALRHFDCTQCGAPLSDQSVKYLKFEVLKCEDLTAIAENKDKIKLEYFEYRISINKYRFQKFKPAVVSEKVWSTFRLASNQLSYHCSG